MVEGVVGVADAEEAAFEHAVNLAADLFGVAVGVKFGRGTGSRTRTN